MKILQKLFHRHEWSEWEIAIVKMAENLYMNHKAQEIYIRRCKKCKYEETSY